jgi:hypothetical protein
VNTSQEAKKKHCPMLRAPCLGQDCMAWRWASVEQLAVAVHNRIRLDDGVGSDPAEFIKEWPNSDKATEGYCGLAGVPLCAN